MRTERNVSLDIVRESAAAQVEVTLYPVIRAKPGGLGFTNLFIDNNLSF